MGAFQRVAAKRIENAFPDPRRPRKLGASLGAYLADDETAPPAPDRRRAERFAALPTIGGAVDRAGTSHVHLEP